MKKNQSALLNTKVQNIQSFATLAEQSTSPKRIKISKVIHKRKADVVTSTYVIRQERINSIYTMDIGSEKSVEPEKNKPLHRITCIETAEQEEPS